MSSHKEACERNRRYVSRGRMPASPRKVSRHKPEYDGPHSPQANRLPAEDSQVRDHTARQTNAVQFQPAGISGSPVSLAFRCCDERKVKGRGDTHLFVSPIPRCRIRRRVNTRRARGTGMSAPGPGGRWPVLTRGTIICLTASRRRRAPVRPGAVPRRSERTPRTIRCWSAASGKSGSARNRRLPRQ